MKTRLLAVISPPILLSLSMFFSIPSPEANPTHVAFIEKSLVRSEYCLDYNEECDSTLPSSAHRIGQYTNEEMILEISLVLDTKVKIRERRKPCAGKLT